MEERRKSADGSESQVEGGGWKRGGSEWTDEVRLRIVRRVGGWKAKYFLGEVV